MNFQQCRYVEVVARVGSFSQAAKELYMTQPNLSCSIKDLENELGVQLFTRSNTGARLTEDGHDFLKYAKRIIGELDLLRGHLCTRVRRPWLAAKEKENPGRLFEQPPTPRSSPRGLSRRSHEV